MHSETRDLNLSEAEGALAAAVLELVRHTRENDSPAPEHIARFALFTTEALLDERPELSSLLPKETLDRASGDPHHLTSIETGTQHADVADELRNALWPEGCAGGYVQARIRGAIDGSPGTAPAPVFVAAGALTTGETFSAVAREGEELRVGRDLIPELVATLCASLGIDSPGASADTKTE
ncbi:Uncharacterised protein [Mycobacteroides abscessus subsp. abscessus]|uniref:hypothetical protein n=1 Tax=Dermabacter vaginalis TaxID=1630135 RepID=UPI00092A5701|nr:hypothetical protein [Dermabacter vaginalis]MCG7442932.1 hypothetical protein [Dermabacter vaginalis]SHX45722.1 Uncharacterised protein [Mycobacteroides abscessus subsp. abscessus]